MHQDKKVGLALALLVIGFVGAFCLRQDHNTTTVDIPELNDPHYLDEQIADKDRTPYLNSKNKSKSDTLLGSEQSLTGLSDDSRLNSGSKISAPTISHSTSTSPNGKKTSKADRWGPIPDFLKDVEIPDGQFSNSELSDSAFEPNPKQQPAFESAPTESNQFRSNRVKPGPNNAWEVSPLKQKTEPSRPDTRRSPQLRIHSVKSGETLSEISIRYLGTSRRYREIFNLNRDQLRSPNDIREGMKLRIPVSPANQTKPQSANNQTFNGTSANAGKRVMGQMVSQPTLKSGSSTVQFEGLIESLSSSKDQNSLKDIDHQKKLQQLEDTLKDNNLLDRKQQTKSLKENYRKFIPIPRSPLTPRSGSSTSKKNAQKLKQSLSQVQPENVKQIVEGLFEEVSVDTNQSEFKSKSKTYTIKKGDTLESIAVRLYGKRSAAFQIYQKNSKMLKNANYIRPGMVLQLP